ncbi:hypothetical protein O6H91_15G071300 [Diphasiastrum complanatum]|uniref:Uncharacterized protein n=1 Tax=Diphasiastrum complanatum TaxID=34168 RepID=A0ACC2BJH3_DIPCM|nr:hypothetical protein O6H91_15G071300 [Diphasiastrum complanatum]
MLHLSNQTIQLETRGFGNDMLTAYFRVCIARNHPCFWRIGRQKTMIIRPLRVSLFRKQIQNYLRLNPTSTDTLGSCLYICEGICVHDSHGLCYPRGRTELSKEWLYQHCQ